MLQQCSSVLCVADGRSGPTRITTTKMIGRRHGQRAYHVRADVLQQCNATNAFAALCFLYCKCRPGSAAIDEGTKTSASIRCMYLREASTFQNPQHVQTGWTSPRVSCLLRSIPGMFTAPSTSIATKHIIDMQGHYVSCLSHLVGRESRCHSSCWPRRSREPHIQDRLGVPH
jgi:hypothetical protein